MSEASTLHPVETLGEQDIHLFREGTHGQLYRKLGCQLGDDGGTFAVWAPNADAVSVIGDFNDWSAMRTRHARAPTARACGRPRSRA